MSDSDDFINVLYHNCKNKTCNKKNHSYQMLRMHKKGIDELFKRQGDIFPFSVMVGREPGKFNVYYIFRTTKAWKRLYNRETFQRYRWMRYRLYTPAKNYHIDKFVILNDGNNYISITKDHQVYKDAFGIRSE